MADRVVETPLGAMCLVASDGVLVSAGWVEAPLGGEASPVLDAAEEALTRYFAGALGALAEVPVGAPGTQFQQAVWRAVRGIAPGHTSTYGAIAAHLGNPAAMRAVGAANGANPVALFVPCHRVIGADGRLVGYAGGLDRKRWLLGHEASQASLFGGGVV